MNFKILSILLVAAFLTTTPAVAKEKKEKAKTEQPKTDKKLKKAKNPNGFSNYKLYTLTCKRGELVMSLDGTRLSSGIVRTDAPKEDKQFAIITIDGKQYLYSPKAKKFLGDGIDGNLLVLESVGVVVVVVGDGDGVKFGDIVGVTLTEVGEDVVHHTDVGDRGAGKE